MAVNLLDEFEEFLIVQDHMEELRKRKETDRAVSRMLNLIAKACEFVRDNTETGFLGRRICRALLSLAQSAPTKATYLEESIGRR